MNSQILSPALNLSQERVIDFGRTSLAFGRFGVLVK